MPLGCEYKYLGPIEFSGRENGGISNSYIQAQVCPAILTQHSGPESFKKSRHKQAIRENVDLALKNSVKMIHFIWQEPWTFSIY